MIYLFLFGLIVICVLLLCAWLYEKRDGMAVLRAAKRYRDELEEERRRSDTVVKERGEALAKCEELADKNASLEHDVAALRKSTVDYVFSDWECIKDVENVRDYYLEKEGMRIIVEDDKATSGFYSKEGPGEYVKPVAKVVDDSD